MDEDMEEMDLVNLLVNHHHTMEPEALRSGVKLLRELRDQHLLIADKMSTILFKIDPNNTINNTEDN